jgi:steroid 5-alpha reductase family enzyme
MLSFPLIGLVVVVYNVLAFSVGLDMARPAFAYSLPSGVLLTITIAEILACAALILLFFEIFRATRTHATTFLEYVLSIGVLVVCVGQFLFVAACGTTQFLIITLVALIDTVARFTLTMSATGRAPDTGDEFEDALDR